MSILNDPVIKILREKNDLLFEMRGYSNVISFAIDERSNLEKKVKELDEKQAKLENKPDLKIAKQTTALEKGKMPLFHVSRAFFPAQISMRQYGQLTRIAKGGKYFPPIWGGGGGGNN